MPVFEYRAIDESGKATTGIIDADSPREARSKLRLMNLYTTKVVESREEVALTAEVKVKRLVRRIKARDIVATTRQLATLLKSGMPLVQSLSAIIEQLEKHPLQRVMFLIREKVNAGSSFADALSDFPKYFSDLYVNMVRAGETSGALEVILTRLADYMESSMKQRNRIRASFIYPAFIIFIGGAVVTFLMTVVVPSLTKIFTEMGRAMPLPTRMLMSFSDFVKSYYFLIVVFGLIACIILLKIYTRKGRGKYIYDSFKLRLPVLGTLVRKISIARFARTLGTLLSGGIPLLQSMEIVKKVIGNSVLAEVVERSKERVAEGEPIADELKKSKEFPPIVVHMVTVGETSGNLEEMLRNVAETYDNEVETTTNSLISLLEPTMIIIVGAIVGFIVLSILLPIFEMNKFAR